MIKDFDSAYIDFTLERDYPTPVPEPSLDGVQLAMGGSGAGKYKTDKTMTDAGMGLFDTLAGALRGTTAQALGLPGDVESLVRLLSGGEQVLPTTEDINKKLPPVVPPGAPNAAERQKTADVANTLGEFNPIIGAPELVKPVVKGAKAAGKALAPTAANMMEGGLRKSGMIMDIVPPGPNVVSTRLPTAKKATEDPIQNKLVIDYNAAKADPEAFTHNMGLIKQYPNFVSKARAPEKQAEDFISHVKDNLLYLYDQVPEQTRQRSKLWYDGARNITDRFSGEYGVPDQAVSGVLAVLSPQKDWFMNVSLGQRVIDIARNQAGRRWDDAMENTASVIWADPKYKPVIDLVRGKSYAELKTAGERALWLRTFDQAFNPREHQIVSPEGDFMGVRMTQSGAPYKTGWGSLNEIGKAISILDNPTLENISTMLGQQHKVRNFYNNIYAPGDPAGHVTIDTHAVAAGLLRPLSGNSREVLHNFGSGVLGEVGPKNSSVTGVQGTYGMFAEAYRRAAAERGVLPREMQSITWEAVRGLFPDTFKTPKNAQVIDDIWVKYRKGKLSLEEARNEVIRTAGGIQPPEWERAGLRQGSAGAGGPAADAGELSGPGVSGGSAGGSGRVQPAAGDSPSVTRGRRAPSKGAQ
jgi:hypothetical protein